MIGATSSLTCDSTGNPLSSMYFPGDAWGCAVKMILIAMNELLELPDTSAASIFSRLRGVGFENRLLNRLRSGDWQSMGSPGNIQVSIVSSKNRTTHRRVGLDFFPSLKLWTNIHRSNVKSWASWISQVHGHGPVHLWGQTIVRNPSEPICRVLTCFDGRHTELKWYGKTCC